MNNILIIGHLGGNKVFLDGQTVKTKILHKELTNRVSNKIYCVDTYLNKVSVVKLIFASIWGILRCKKIIILLSQDGMKVYFPMLYWASKLLKREVYHNVIGGNLDLLVKDHPAYVKYLNSFKGNWLEYEGLCNRVKATGVKSCAVVPNFKDLNIADASIEIDGIGKRSLCMFSRVMEEKGMTTAIENIRKYNSEHEDGFLLNIWGPLDHSYKEEFEQLLSENEFVKYHGCVDYAESVKTLTNHIALLFPTSWFGEGLPGTIIDAYASGLPVVASDWNANKELVDDFVTGWVYPNSEVKDLQESLCWIACNRNKMIEMRRNCLNHYKQFSSDTVMSFIIKEMGLTEK